MYLYDSPRLGKPIIALRHDTVRTAVKNHGTSAEATNEASRLMNEVFASLSSSNVGALDGISVQLHILPYNKQLTDLPDYKKLKGQRGPDGRAYDLMRASVPTRSGLSIVFAIGEEEIVTTSARPPHFRKGFAVSHDSGLVVARYALSEREAKRLQKAFEDRRNSLADWVGPEAAASPEKYFASSTAAFFGHARSIGAPDPFRFTREWLKNNDAPMYALLKDVYKRAA